MNTEPKAVATRFYEVISNWADGGLDEVCAPDLRGHAGAGANLDELKASISSFTSAFPDLRVEVRHLIQEGDTVSAWLSYQGTHKGEFAGVLGSDRPIKIAAWDLIRVRDGRIVELTQYCDLFTLMNQIGALPTATPA
ncbi:ester cyclase [Streptomyces sp. NPDC023998]|uniref:ester cyclase n=1 Tax=Streptomyces sp. NPDC023998 TaxID=3154597 RepID=UPI0033CC25D8